MVPCYNEEEALPYLYDALCKVMDECSKYEYELIFVNDGSRDKTLSVLKDMAEKDSRVHYISFSRNFGKEAAMYAGLDAAKSAKLDAQLEKFKDIAWETVPETETAALVNSSKALLRSLEK